MDRIVWRIQDGFTAMSGAMVAMTERLDPLRLFPGVSTCGFSGMAVSGLLNFLQGNWLPSEGLSQKNEVEAA